MDSLEGLQKRIKTTQDLRSIVTTMKSLSAVSILQYDTALKSLREYSRTVNLGVIALFKNDALQIADPVVVKAEHRRALAVVVGSDTGLVGKLNREVFRFAQDKLKSDGFDMKKAGYIAVGRQIIGQMHGKDYNMCEAYPVSNTVKAVGNTAASVLVRINELIDEEGYTHVFVFYSRKEGTTVHPVSLQLMPFSYEWVERLKKINWPGHNFPTFSLPASEINSALVRERVMIDLCQSITEELSAEHHMRLTTMQAAEKNIDENLEKMNLQYQQIRQENITTELLDVVSGAEALRKQDKKK